MDVGTNQAPTTKVTEQPLEENKDADDGSSAEDNDTPARSEVNVQLLNGRRESHWRTPIRDPVNHSLHAHLWT